MIINNANLTALRTGFQTVFQGALMKMRAESQYGRVSTFIKSSDKEETYGWLKQLPGMRDWVGPRLINALAEDGFKIANKPFELTVGVSRYDIMFDKLGTYAPRFEMMGRSAGEQPDKLLWDLVKTGFAANGFDGQFFFDTDHPVFAADGSVTSYANTDGGAGAPWFLIDTRKGMMPFIYQEAIAPNFVAKDQPTDDRVFELNEYVYGVDMYCRAGFGMPQLAWGSKQALTAANYASARAAMGSLKGDGGTPLGIVPNLLVVPPSLEGDGRKIVNSEYGAGGVTNEWKGTAELMMVPWLA